MYLAVGAPLFRGSTFDLRFNIIERSNTLKRFFCDLRAAEFPKVMERAPGMRPTCRLFDANVALVIRLVEILKACIGVSLQNALKVPEMTLRMLALSIGREVIDDPRWRRPRPWSIISDIDSGAPLTDILIKASSTS